MTNRDSFDCRIRIVELTELQTSHFALRTSDAAFDENLTHYTDRIDTSPLAPGRGGEEGTLFWFNALLIASNGTDSRVGSLTADWEVLAHAHLLRGPSRTGTRRIEREDEPRRGSLDVMLRGTCHRASV